MTLPEVHHSITSRRSGPYQSHHRVSVSHRMGNCTLSVVKSDIYNVHTTTSKKKQHDNNMILNIKASYYDKNQNLYVQNIPRQVCQIVSS